MAIADIIKEGLRCEHCNCLFTPTYKQAWNAKNIGSRPFCSVSCRNAAASIKNAGKINGKDPMLERVEKKCENCGKGFVVRITEQQRQFCNMKCYSSSEQFRERMSAQSKAYAARPDYKAANYYRKDCIECGEEIKNGHKKKMKYCSQKCYRAYMAKRYDRWIANPKNIGCLQGYDEFLSQETLPCLVEGCLWEGQDLAAHVIAAHGIPLREFKRAAGFNYGSALVGIGRLEKYKNAEHNSLNFEKALAVKPKDVTWDNNPDKYYSRERKEHKAKSDLERRYRS